MTGKVGAGEEDEGAGEMMMDEVDRKYGNLISPILFYFHFIELSAVACNISGAIMQLSHLTAQHYINHL